MCVIGSIGCSGENIIFVNLHSAYFSRIPACKHLVLRLWILYFGEIRVYIVVGCIDSAYFFAFGNKVYLVSSRCIKNVNNILFLVCTCRDSLIGSGISDNVSPCLCGIAVAHVYFRILNSKYLTGVFVNMTYSYIVLCKCIFNVYFENYFIFVVCSYRCVINLIGYRSLSRVNELVARDSR